MNTEREPQIVRLFAGECGAAIFKGETKIPERHAGRIGFFECMEDRVSYNDLLFFDEDNVDSEKVMASLRSEKVILRETFVRRCYKIRAMGGEICRYHNLRIVRGGRVELGVSRV